MNEALKEFQLHLVPTAGFLAAVFHCDGELLIFKVTVEMERED